MLMSTTANHLLLYIRSLARLDKQADVIDAKVHGSGSAVGPLWQVLSAGASTHQPASSVNLSIYAYALSRLVRNCY